MTENKAPLLEVRGLVKEYGKLTAVAGIDLVIRPGICFGLLGPNGAGKTTALEMIEGIISPTKGDIFYKGQQRGARFKEEVGIQFQKTDLLAFLTVADTLATFQSLYEDTVATADLARLCRIEEILGLYNDKISGGQRQRLLLALALINKPELIFLDEPSTGLDPQARRNLWDIVEQVKAGGKTIILTTHSMEEAEYLCDEIAIMDKGRIIAQGAPAALIRKHCQGVTVTVPRAHIPLPIADLPFPVCETNGLAEMQTGDIKDCLRQLMDLNVDLSDMTIHSPNLEDVFLYLTGRGLRD